MEPGPGGLRVDAVVPDGLAARIGLQPDDILVELAGAPVSDHRALETALRVLMHTATTEPAARWVRDGELTTR